MGWFSRRKSVDQENRAARYVLDVALKQGDLISTLRIAGSYSVPLGPDETGRAIERLRASDRTNAQKAEHLIALLYLPTFSNRAIYFGSKRERLAEEVIQLDPSLKAKVARLPAIDGTLRVRLVREMLAEKKFPATDILEAIPKVVYPQNAWDVEFCQQLVAYALERGELHTAYAAAHAPRPE